MISCGKECVCCDFPVHMDTYRGCEHGCLYCRVRKKYTIANAVPLKSVVALKRFISGQRNSETKWCDWAIPLQWGANSDPFQPCESEHHVSLDCLKIFAESGYPFIITTKNPVMLTEEPYFSLIKRCNVLMQCSMACSKYDKIEPGAPKYEQRLEAMTKLAKVTKRAVIRVQPYFIDALDEVLKQIPRWGAAGIHGILIDGFVSQKKHPQMERVGSFYFFSNDVLFKHFSKIKAKCHEHGLEFTCTEDGLQWMSDHTTCCGAHDLEGFKPHTYNADHLAAGDAELTAAMLQVCPQPFKCIGQSQAWAYHCKDKTFKELVDEQAEEAVAFYHSEKARLGG